MDKKLSFARTIACVLQKRYRGEGGVHHSPPLSFLVPLYTCSPIMFDDLLLSFISAFSLAGWGVQQLHLHCVLPGASFLAVINCNKWCFPDGVHL